MVIYSISRSIIQRRVRHLLSKRPYITSKGSKVQYKLKSLEITFTVLLVCLCFLPAPDQHFPLQKIDAAHRFFRSAQQAVFYLPEG